MCVRGGGAGGGVGCFMDGWCVGVGGCFMGRCVSQFLEVLIGH